MADPFRLYVPCPRDGSNGCDVTNTPHRHHVDGVWLAVRNAGHTTNDNDPRRAP